MYKLYLKQAWNQIRQELSFSLIYIIGTGLSVSMVMLLSMVVYVKVADIYPETNRSRMLIAKSGMEYSEKQSNSSSLSEAVIRSCFSSLQGVETLGLIYNETETLFLQAHRAEKRMAIPVKWVDTQFWRIFPFRFIAGKPFTDADFQSGIRTSVISESTARRIFGTNDVVGKTFSLNFNDYRICGVVKDASPLTEISYAGCWIPYTANKAYKPNEAYGEMGALGPFKAYLLAAETADLSEIKKEAEKNIRRYSTAQQTDLEFTMLGQPDSYWQSTMRQWSDTAPDFTRIMLLYGIVFLILLLIPAVSLSGMADSRMERRMTEMGIRRSFGAKVTTLMLQIIVENFLFTLLGGCVGLCVSYLLFFLTKDWIMHAGQIFQAIPEGATVTILPEMLLNWPIFFTTLLVCFLLNLFSVLIPAYAAARRPIINSLNIK